MSGRFIFRVSGVKFIQSRCSHGGKESSISREAFKGKGGSYLAQSLYGRVVVLLTVSPISHYQPMLQLREAFKGRS